MATTNSRKYTFSTELGAGYNNNNNHNNNNIPNSLFQINNQTKRILFLNKYWDGLDFQFGLGREPFIRYDCPVHNCWTQSAFAQDDTSVNPNDNDDDMYNTPFTSFSHMARNYSSYDAIMISIQDYDHFTLNEDDENGRMIRQAIQSWRQPHQRFIFVMMESPAYPSSQLTPMNGFFNWTMTYKWNSDIPRPYGWFQPKKVQEQQLDVATSTTTKTTTTTTTTIRGQSKASTTKSSQSFAYAQRPTEWIPYQPEKFQQHLQSLPPNHDLFKLARRPGKVAWIVSNCETHSLREDYVYQLRRYISVDEFGGKCQSWSPTCDKSYTIAFDDGNEVENVMDNCTRRVQNDYKFYLAFENAFCNDYVTEKFFGRMEHAIVITLGQANYSQIAPPHSFINIFDFDSAKALADYLIELDQDDEKYLSYFWWKDYYQVKNPFGVAPHRNTNQVNNHADGSASASPRNNNNNFGQAMCRLCEKLHDPNEPSYKVYNDMEQWWKRSAECGKRLPALKQRMKNDPALPGFRPYSDPTSSQWRQHLGSSHS